MSVNENRRKRDFAQYDSMSTEDLEQILRQDAEAPAEQESDTDKLLYVMEVLARRNRETNCTGATPQEAWTSFREHYAPDPEAVKSDKPARPWLRRLIAAAAAVFLILSIPITARALGWDEFWDVVARWAKETFSFVSEGSEDASEPEPTDAIEYTSLQDLLKRNNRPYDMVPTWIPDGFVQNKVEKDISPLMETYRAFYMFGNREIEISVQLYLIQDSRKAEIDQLIEEYNYNGVSYYFFSNYNQLQVVWVDSDYECIISGDLNLDEAKKMIRSIERG